MGKWLPGAGNKREQMNRSEGVFLGNTRQGGRSWPCELSCAFARSSTKPFLLGKAAALGTQPATGRALLAQLLQHSLSRQQSRAWVRGKSHPENFGVWDGYAGVKRAAAALPLAWGRHRIWQSHGGSHCSREACGHAGDRLATACVKKKPGEESIPEAACRGG